MKKKFQPAEGNEEWVISHKTLQSLLWNTFYMSSTSKHEVTKTAFICISINVIPNVAPNLHEIVQLFSLLQEDEDWNIICRGYISKLLQRLNMFLLRCLRGESIPCWAAAGKDTLPRWQQPRPSSLCSTAESVSSTPAAGPSQLCPPAGLPPTRSPGRRRSRSALALSLNKKKQRGVWEVSWRRRPQAEMWRAKEHEMLT